MIASMLHNRCAGCQRPAHLALDSNVLCSDCSDGLVAWLASVGWGPLLKNNLAELEQIRQTRLLCTCRISGHDGCVVHQ